MLGSVREQKRKERYEVRQRLILEQDRRCGVCTNEMQDRSKGTFQITGRNLIVCRQCWSLYRHVVKYQGLVMDKVLELVREGCSNDKGSTEKKP